MARKKKKASKKSNRAMLVAAVFLGTVTTTLLSFISFELALLSFGFFSLGLLYTAEARRRNFWEQAASFKFKNLKDTQELLTKEMIMRVNEIDDLKDDMEDAQARIEDLQSKPVIKDKLAAMPGRSPLPFELEAKPLTRSPRAIKPKAYIEAPPKPETHDNYESVSDTVVRELLHHAMKDKRVDVFVQPIQRLPQRQPRFYEMFARIRARPGQYLPASRYMEIAEQDNLDGEIDNLLLLHCLKTLEGSAHIQHATPFFINIKNSTLTDMAFMQRLLGFIKQNRDLAKRLVFEMKQKDFDAMSPALLDVLRGLGKLGVSFSLDHVENLKMDIADLQHFKIRYVKFAAQKLIASSSDQNFAALHKTKRRLEANGIGMIVERIENEQQMRELMDYDVHYGQGYLLGKPELEGAYKKRTRVRRMGLQEDVA